MSNTVVPDYRAASQDDFAYCERIYFEESARLIEAVGLELSAHRMKFVQQWSAPEVQMIMVKGRDVGWFRAKLDGPALYLGQLFIERSFQRQGFGTAVLRHLLDQASREGRPMRLSVVKINPALALYQRLGFLTTHEDALKFHMQYDPA
jgi:ribosomal protein S18 acetylase RimI-like enzyme